ncbi:hypothetical protein [Streptomyces sp. NPDC057718]|uniref:hypothetical protein n=1 Tax=Streptomyces sp. NPDC057718 TaxID=3346225 RepID=UPI00369F1F2E
MDANQVTISHDAFDALLDASSLGAPRVQALRRLTPSAVQEHLASRRARQDAADPGHLQRTALPAERDMDQAQSPAQRHEQEQDLDHERQDGSRSHLPAHLKSFPPDALNRFNTSIFFMSHPSSQSPEDPTERSTEAGEGISGRVITENLVRDTEKANYRHTDPSSTRFHRNYTLYLNGKFDGTSQWEAGLAPVRNSNSENPHANVFGTISRIGMGDRARANLQSLWRRDLGRDAQGRQEGAVYLLAAKAFHLLVRASAADPTTRQSERFEASQVLYIVAPRQARPRLQETVRPAAAQDYLSAVALTCELGRILAGQGSGGRDARRPWLDGLDPQQDPAAAHSTHGSEWEHFKLRCVPPPLAWRDRPAAATCRDAVRSAFVDEHQMLKERILAAIRDSLTEEFWCPANWPQEWSGDTFPSLSQADGHAPLAAQEISAFACTGTPPRFDSNETFTELVAAAQKLLNLFQGDSSTLVLPANKKHIGLMGRATVRRIPASGKPRQ